jgi:DNA repair protein RecO (recombination protein O)
MGKYKETSGYIIHTRNYKDTSLIIEFFSQDLGMIHLIAKGIKKNKTQKTQLQLFSLVKIQFFGKSSLKTLTSINIINAMSLEGIHERTAALYLNELLHLCLTESDVVQELFESYQYSLNAFGQRKITYILRKFEQSFLKFNGFELHVDEKQADNNWLSVDENSGLFESNIKSKQLCKVSDLKSFLYNLPLNREEQIRLNRLMRALIDLCVSYRKIKCREMLLMLIKKP